MTWGKFSQALTREVNLDKKSFNTLVEEIREVNQITDSLRR